jgi:hypothetical protein
MVKARRVEPVHRSLTVKSELWSSMQLTTVFVRKGSCTRGVLFSGSSAFAWLILRRGGRFGYEEKIKKSNIGKGEARQSVRCGAAGVVAMGNTLKRISGELKRATRRTSVSDLVKCMRINAFGPRADKDPARAARRTTSRLRRWRR